MSIIKDNIFRIMVLPTERGKNMNIGSISDSEANAFSVIVNDAPSSKNDSKEIRDKYHIPNPVLCAEESRVCPIINKVLHEHDCYEFIMGCSDTPQYKCYSKWNGEEMREICDKCEYNAFDW